MIDRWLCADEGILEKVWQEVPEVDGQRWPMFNRLGSLLIGSTGAYVGGLAIDLFRRAEASNPGAILSRVLLILATGGIASLLLVLLSLVLRRRQGVAYVERLGWTCSLVVTTTVMALLGVTSL
jgi:hypothetical protein